VIDIESMHYGTSYLPFPSVTLCPNDRVDWNRVLELELKIFPNGTDKASLETFRKILGKLSMMSFRDFDELDFLKNQNVHSLAGKIFIFFLNFFMRSNYSVYNFSNFSNFIFKTLVRNKTLMFYGTYLYGSFYGTIIKF